jgi:hypothetical protein
MTILNIYQKKERFLLFACISAVFSLVSCQKQPTLTFGSSYLTDNSSANIVVVDTCTVDLSTTYVDSSFTAGTGYLNVGRLVDPLLGTITTRAFMQVAPGSLPTISTFDNYDSICLILRYKKGNPYYGDTTIVQTYNVAQVDSLYELPAYSNGWNSKSTLPVSSTIWGSTSATIRPSIPFTSQSIGDTLKIRLTDDLGKQLFNMIYNKSDTIEKSAQWLKWFHGLCISPADGSQGAIYGFQDSAIMRIYYHPAAPEIQTKFIDFGITNKSYQFNNIVTDRSTSALANLNKPTQLKQSPPTTSSTLTGHAAYLQTITGLNVKLTFPYLGQIAKRDDYISVLSAQLTVRPVPDSWSSTWTLPPSVSIYTSDLNNVPISSVYNSTTGAAQTGSMTVNYLTPLSTYYTYDVTSFVKNQITNTATTAGDAGLLLEVASGNNYSSFQRLLVADASYPVTERVKLAVYYISVYPHQ